MRRLLNNKQLSISNKFTKVKKDNIVILSDSLSLPRSDDLNIITLEQSYPFLLQQKIGNNFNIINRGIRFTTTNSLVDFQYLFDNLIIYSPRKVIVQMGIVDCAPRLFSSFFRKLINRIKNEKIRNAIILPFKKNRKFFTKYFKIRMVSKSNFKKNIQQFLRTMKNLNIDVTLVNIPYTNKKNSNKSYGFNESIKDYNNLILDLKKDNKFHLIDINKESISQRILVDDGIHYNKNGCNIVANMLYESITKS